jgi:monovalent cation:H+ antiporter-2, CPA2 family
VKGQPELLVELGAVLLVLSVLALGAARIGLSPVPLFLLAGIPLNAGVGPDLTSSPFIASAAEIGAVLLLLTLGLEFSAPELTASLKRHGPSGLVDLVLNAAPGAAAGVLLGLEPVGVLALAGVTWISSSGIVARLLSDLGRLGNRETPAVLSVLVIEDIGMAAFLPLVAVLLAGGGPGDAALAVGLAVGVVATVLVLARRVGGPLERLLRTDDDEQQLLRLLAITFLVAGITGLLEASAAVGAFLVGLAIPGRAAERARTVVAPLRDLFAAVFFLAFGLSIDPADLLPVLPVALALALVTALTKIASGGYAAKRDGVGVRGRLRAGTVLIPRGEFSVVIAGLAALGGYPEIAQITAAYVLALALIGPLAARAADPLGRWWVGRTEVDAGT